VSPFIVTTTRSCNCEPSTCESDGLLYHETRCNVFKVPRSEREHRRAVATLEGQPGIADVRKAELMASRPQGLGYTLPDGTTIQVEPAEWHRLGPDVLASALQLGERIEHWPGVRAPFSPNAKHGLNPSKCGSPGSAEPEAVGLPNPSPKEASHELGMPRQYRLPHRVLGWRVPARARVVVMPSEGVDGMSVIAPACPRATSTSSAARSPAASASPRQSRIFPQALARVRGIRSSSPAIHL
jgi:hypothetical protein